MSDDQEQESNKNTLKKEAVSDGEENSGRKGGKRKLSRQKSSQPEFKRRKSNSTSPDLTADTEGTSCLLTPSASPRPSDTFDYEMKMSLFGKSLSITEDNTVYSDASKWSIDDVAEFFKKNGYDEQAQVFQDQEIDGPSLLLMRREDVLTALGLKLGPALKIYQKIVKLQNCSQSVSV